MIVASHFGRPKGKPVPAMSLGPARRTACRRRSAAAPVRFVADCIGAEAEKAVATLAPGEVLLLENLRFHPGEEAKDPAFRR